MAKLADTIIYGDLLVTGKTRFKNDIILETEIKSDFIPDADNIYSIGTALLRFSNIYAYGLDINGDINTTGIYNGNASGLTNINASNISTGTLADARLSSNITLLNGTQTITGAKTFSTLITGSISGNAGTATTLQTARTIGGVSFNGSANINLPGVDIGGNQNTTGSAATLTTARTLTIGSTGKTFNGSANVSWTLAEIGAAASSHTHAIADVTSLQSSLDAKLASSVWVPATTLTLGYMTTTQVTKLDGIAAGAQVNVATNLGITAGTTAGPVVTSSTGTNATLPTASETASGVITTGAQTFAGVKTFSSTITGSITGNAGTATTLQTARTIGGVSFNGSANINLPGVNTIGNQNTTGSAATLTTARTLTIGSTGKTFNGSANVAWTLGEIGAAAASHNHSGADITSGTLADARLSSNVATLNGTQTITGAKTFSNVLTTLVNNSTNLTTARTAVIGLSNANQGRIEFRSGRDDSSFTGRYSSIQSWSNTLGSARPLILQPEGNFVGIGLTNPHGTLSVLGEGRVVTIGDSGVANVPILKSRSANDSGYAFMRYDAFQHQFHVQGSSVLNVSSNGISWSGTATGSGASLTSLNASNISSGTLADARLPSSQGGKTFTSNTLIRSSTANGYATLASGNAAAVPGYIGFHTSEGTRRGFIGWASGSNLLMKAENGWGWSIDGQVTFNTPPIGSGASLTSLNASNISTGTINDARLPDIITRKTFSQDIRFSTVLPANNDQYSSWSDGLQYVPINASGALTGFSGAGTVLSVIDRSIRGFQLAVSHEATSIAIRGVHTGQTGGLSSWQYFYHTGNFDPASKLDTNGNGSSLTSLNASNISSGTLNTARLPATINYTVLNGVASATKDKIRVWNSSTYAIGMDTTYTYGHLNDYAMTFQMSNTANRGFWWGHASHTKAQGAMSLTTDGRLYVGNLIDCVGDITAYASDIRLKSNITPITSALEKVMSIRGVEYDWNDNVEELGFHPYEKRETGLIAQELQKVLPNAVRPAPFDKNYLTIKYERVVPLLVEAIKEQKSENDQLKERLKILEDKINKFVQNIQGE